jgi:hypothetical protein
VTVKFDWEAIDLLEARILAAEPKESALLSSYDDLWERLGHRPTLVETPLRARFILGSFWHFLGVGRKCLRPWKKDGWTLSFFGSLNGCSFPRREIFFGRSSERP